MGPALQRVDTVRWLPYFPRALSEPAASLPADALVASYGFDLPPGQIAQRPADRRDGARLLIAEGAVDATILDLPGLLAPGDLLVVNDTRVLPAKLDAVKATGGRVQLLLLHPLDGGAWEALVKPSAKLRPGTTVRLRRRGEAGEGPRLVIGADLGGTRRIEPLDEPLDEALLEAWGEMPLPPYIEREAPDPEDRERYQCVFADAPGAMAAPTAGLHFSEPLLAALAARGVELARVTLHVGAGTFGPVRSTTLAGHPMHAERYRVPPGTADAVAAVEARGGRLVAVGTTACRSLESWHRAGRPSDGAWRSTELFLHPGNPPQLPLGLLTNFHLPGSTLLMLVAAFLGRERALALYDTAVQRGYRFYSYGDALLIP